MEPLSSSRLTGRAFGCLLAVIAPGGCNDVEVPVAPVPVPVAEPESDVRILDQQGRPLSIDELRLATGDFEFEVAMNVDVPQRAHELHQRARQLASAGEFEPALELLASAQTLAPDWPYPTYDMAYTRLLTKDFDGALRDYRETVRMAPRGFFTAITAVHSLEREQAGEIPEGTYLAYSFVESLEPDRRRALLDTILERVPDFAPAWKDMALLREDPDERLEALERGLAANPDAETKGMLLLNKALVLNNRGDRKEASEMLRALADDPASTASNAALAEHTLTVLGD